MTEYRFARPDEENDLLDCIDLVFSQSARPHNFRALLPKEYAHPGFAAHHAVAVEDGRIRAAVGMIPLTVQVQGAEPLQGGYIGSVSVHGQARGQGHMRRLMDMQLQAARERGYDFIGLGGQRQRYGYWGFEKCGAGLRFSVSAANVRHALGEEKDPIDFLPVHGEDASVLDALSALHAAQPLYCARPRDRLFETLCSYGARPYVLRRARTGERLGYLTAFEDSISELVLIHGAEDLCDVIRSWMKGKKSCSVYLPAGQAAMIRQMQSFAENFSAADTQMIKVLRWDHLLQTGFALRSAAGLPLPDGRCVVAIGSAAPLALEVRSGRASVAPCAPDTPALRLTEQQAVSCFFSSFGALYPLDPALRPWLPLPFEIPTADQF